MPRKYDKADIKPSDLEFPESNSNWGEPMPEEAKPEVKKEKKKFPYVVELVSSEHVWYRDQSGILKRIRNIWKGINKGETIYL